MFILIAIVAIAFGVFYGILQLPIPGTWKFALVFIEMLAINQILIKRYKFSSELGLILLKSKKGLDAINRLAKSENFFMVFAELGGILSYGALSFPLFGKRLTQRSGILFVAGLVLLAFILVFVAPMASFFLFNILKVGTASTSAGLSSAISSNAQFAFLLILSILVLGGLFLLMTLSIIFYGLVIIDAIITTFFYHSNAIATTAAGGSLLLPGINLPLIEGVLALAVAIAVHEGAHAVLARIGKVNILSSGIVLFGVIPIGAFVEPDEKQLNSISPQKQTDVLVAGSTSNLLTSCLTFLIFLGFVNVLHFFNITQSSSLYPFLYPVYLTLGLIFSLNFIIGSVNLLPIPLFDGYRILELNIKNKHVVQFITYAVVIFFLANFLPWLFHG